ncbi:MAG: sulfite exporter TauE/SafE family protein [Rhodospirillales bacterium]
MNIYLPIAEMSQNVLVLLAVGGFVGVLTGIFGVGGGFLLTPFLIFLGIPAPIAVASAANQVLGSSVSGVIGHWRRDGVDVKMGLVLLVGGITGSSTGVWLFGLLRQVGHVDLVISICYVALLGGIGSMMLWESVGAVRRRRGSAGSRTARGARRYPWLNALPLKMRFRKSRLFISPILPAGVGFFVGLLSAIMGVGGGFIMVPAMIYLIGMPSQVVIGTSLFQIIFVAANVVFLQSVTLQTVDVVLAVMLLVGGVVGAQYGVRIGARMASEQIRVFLALLVLSVGAVMLYGLLAKPADLYTVTRLVD